MERRRLPSKFFLWVRPKVVSLHKRCLTQVHLMKRRTGFCTQEKSLPARFGDFSRPAQPGGARQLLLNKKHMQRRAFRERPQLLLCKKFRDRTRLETEARQTAFISNARKPPGTRKGESGARKRKLTHVTPKLFLKEVREKGDGQKPLEYLSNESDQKDAVKDRAIPIMHHREREEQDESEGF